MEHVGSTFFLMESVEYIKIHDDSVQFNIRWLGWEDEDEAWKPLQKLKNDVRTLLEDFLHTLWRGDPKFTVVELFF